MRIVYAAAKRLCRAPFIQASSAAHGLARCDFRFDDDAQGGDRRPRASSKSIRMPGLSRGIDRPRARSSGAGRPVLRPTLRSPGGNRPMPRSRQSKDRSAGTTKSRRPPAPRPPRQKRPRKALAETRAVGACAGCCLHRAASSIAACRGALLYGTRPALLLPRDRRRRPCRTQPLCRRDAGISDRGAIAFSVIGVRIGDPLLGVDPQDEAAAIRRLSWVRDVRVERRLPDTLYIKHDRARAARPLAGSRQSCA